MNTVVSNATVVVSEIERAHMGFMRACDMYRSQPGLAIGQQVWTYEQLGFETRRLANCILNTTSNPTRVGILACRTKTGYVATMASLLAGCAFIPLNKSYPAARNVAIVEQARPEVIVVDEQCGEQITQILNSLSFQPKIIFAGNRHQLNNVDSSIHIIDQSTINEFSSAPVQLFGPVNDDAYILFTSGSTGVPKGVPISHGNLMYFLKQVQSQYQITSSDRLSQTFDHTFDLSVFDLFMTWSHGACLCVPQPIELLSPTVFVNKHALTVWFSVPSVINRARAKNSLRPNSMPSLRLSLFCGEPLTADSAEAWQNAACNSILENLYGPTELTIACTTYRWDRSSSHAESENGVVPIGKAYDGLDARIVDDQMQDVLPGAAGELCICGPQMFRGYLHNEEKTRSVTFFRGHDRYYRTGDKVKVGETGNLIYMGRIDDQVKINGYRVELQEIEAVIREFDGVDEVCVVGWPKVQGTYTGLAAFITGTMINERSLADYLKTKLPAFMVPGKIVSLNRLPLNSNGKTDRPALRASLDQTAAQAEPIDDNVAARKIPDGAVKPLDVAITMFSEFIRQHDPAHAAVEPLQLSQAPNSSHNTPDSAVKELVKPHRPVSSEDATYAKRAS